MPERLAESDRVREVWPTRAEALAVGKSDAAALHLRCEFGLKFFRLV